MNLPTRWLLVLCAITLHCPIAQAQDSSGPPTTPEEKAFFSAAARAIYQVVPADREAFQLTFAARTAPVFVGPNNSPQPLPCEKNAVFQVVGFAKDLAVISFSVCTRVAEVSASARAARSAFDNVLTNLPKQDPAHSKKVGFYYQEESQADGTTHIHTPVLLISRGVALLMTAVLIPPAADRVIVVQANTSRMCDRSRPELDALPLCKDIRIALRDIALSAAAGIPKN